MSKNCPNGKKCGNTCIRKTYKCRYDVPAAVVAGLSTLADRATKTKTAASLTSKANSTKSKGETKKLKARFTKADKRDLSALSSLGLDKDLRAFLESDNLDVSLEMLTKKAGVDFSPLITLEDVLKSKKFKQYREKPQVVENPEDVAKFSEIWGYRGVKADMPISFKSLGQTFNPETDRNSSNYHAAEAKDYFTGSGLYGNGIYVAVPAKGSNGVTAMSVVRSTYAGRANINGSMQAIGLSKDAKVMDAQSYKKLRDYMNRNDTDSLLKHDPSAVAALLGYDAVLTSESDAKCENHMIVLNRSKTISSKPRDKNEDVWDFDLANLHEGETSIEPTYDPYALRKFDSSVHDKRIARIRSAGDIDINQANALALYLSPTAGLNPDNPKQESFKAINQALYAPDSVKDPNVKQQAKLCVEAIGKLPKADWGVIKGKYNKLDSKPGIPPTLRRAMNMDAAAAEAFVSQFKVGKNWKTLGLMSSSVGNEQDFKVKNLNGGWSDANVELLITPKIKNTKATPMDDYKNAADEGELLYNSGTKFKVKNVTSVNGKYTVELEEA